VSGAVLITTWRHEPNGATFFQDGRDCREAPDRKAFRPTRIDRAGPSAGGFDDEHSFELGPSGQRRILRVLEAIHFCGRAHLLADSGHHKVGVLGGDDGSAYLAPTGSIHGRASAAEGAEPPLPVGARASPHLSASTGSSWNDARIIEPVQLVARQPRSGGRPWSANGPPPRFHGPTS
jgi:hypothetical protein